MNFNTQPTSQSTSDFTKCHWRLWTKKAQRLNKKFVSAVPEHDTVKIIPPKIAMYGSLQMETILFMKLIVFTNVAVASDKKKFSPFFN